MPPSLPSSRNWVPPWIGGKCARRRCWAPLETCTLYWSTTRTLPCSSYCRTTDQLPQSRPDKLPWTGRPGRSSLWRFYSFSPLKIGIPSAFVPVSVTLLHCEVQHHSESSPQKEMTFRGSPNTRFSWRVQVSLHSSEKSRQSSLPSQTAELGINSWDWRQWKLLEQWSSSLASPQSSTRLQTASYFTQFLLRHGK